MTHSKELLLLEKSKNELPKNFQFPKQNVCADFRLSSSYIYMCQVVLLLEVVIFRYLSFS